MNMPRKVALSDEAKRLLAGVNFGHLATLMPDGSPQVTPVWVDHDGEYVLVNTEEERQKPKNMRNDPRVALSITDSENPYKWVMIRGRVVDMTHEGGSDHIDKMAKKYMGLDKYPYYQPDKARIIVKIEPEHVTQS
jgi:PPOX class probable F420-dependent enzyme